MIAATSGPSAAATASGWTRPSGPAGTTRTEKPSAAAVAGLVPWADSGASTTLRVAASPRAAYGGLDRHHAAHFAMGAGLGRQRHGRHVGEREQPVGQFLHQRQRALHGRDRLQRMDVGKARQPRHFLVEARIVLHRAGAERIGPSVDGVIFLRQAHIMAHRLGFGQAGQSRWRSCAPSPPRRGLNGAGGRDRRR